MRPGQLRHNLTIKLRSDVPDEFFGIESSLTEPKQVWGKVESVTGLNLRSGQQITEGVTHKVTMRYLSTLTTEYEITYKALQLRVKAVIQDPRERYTIAECEQITA